MIQWHKYRDKARILPVTNCVVILGFSRETEPIRYTHRYAHRNLKNGFLQMRELPSLKSIAQRVG